MTTTIKTADVGMQVNSPSLHVSGRPLDKNEAISEYPATYLHISQRFKKRGI